MDAGFHSCTSRKSGYLRTERRGSCSQLLQILDILLGENLACGDALFESFDLTTISVTDKANAGIDTSERTLLKPTMGLVILEATQASATWLMDHDFFCASSSTRWTILLSDSLSFFSNGLPTVAFDLSVSVPRGRARSPVSSGEYAMTPIPLYSQYGSSSSSYGFFQ